MELSIIIPVFNDLRAISLTLDALRKQTYSKEYFEVIVVDNGSTDGSIEYLEKQDDIIFIKEHVNLGSPYSCRNRGIEVSKGEFVVFLDSTCIPQINFVERGLEFLKNSDCAMFGGNIIFNFDGHVTGAKIYDSISNIQMRIAVLEKNVAKTANLWVKRYVFEKVGVFLEGVRSGDDVGFTTRCTQAGMILVFCEECVAYKFARGFKELVKKQFRVGKGKVDLWYNQGILAKELLGCWRYLIPLFPKTFKKMLKRNQYTDYTFLLKVTAYTTSCICKQATLWGILFRSFSIKKGQNN